jgi:hypothetical protein
MRSGDCPRHHLDRVSVGVSCRVPRRDCPAALDDFAVRTSERWLREEWRQ